ncbi:hypothetical protein [Streptomyces lydicus]|uniref:hypothetical protein n=1 Tax=Streptomyces lydicus TaxID=47763 RepID=UPI00379F11B3
MGLSLGVRLLFIVAALLAAIIVGMTAGVLTYLGGAKLPVCILRGGASVAATMTILVLVMTGLGVLA